MKDIYWWYFLIWDNTHDRLDDFILGLNHLKPRLKFTATISFNSVIFLDLVIRKGPIFCTSGKFETYFFFTSTNTFSYIHGTSSHPHHTYKGIAIGECIQILRACSLLGDFNKHQGHLIKTLHSLHFSRRAISSVKAVPFDSREHYLVSSKKINSNKVIFSTKFCHHIPSIHSVP